MEIRQIKGNTWVFEGYSLMPFYRMGDQCILMDNGLPHDGDVIERVLAEHNITPIGQLCTHAHIDHCANSARFQRKYNLEVGLTAAEAGCAVDVMNFKAMRTSVSPKSVRDEMSEMVLTSVTILPDCDGKFTFCGVDFVLTHTAGHSAGHACFTTPDGVCYAGDALMSADMMDSKLPYALDVATALVSQQKLLTIEADTFILSHRGVVQKDQLPDLIQQNTALFHKRSEEILSFCDKSPDFSTLCKLVCQHFELHMRKPQRVLFFQRNIRFFLEFLEDSGKLVMDVDDGKVVYRKVCE